MFCKPLNEEQRQGQQRLADDQARFQLLEEEKRRTGDSVGAEAMRYLSQRYGAAVLEA